MSTINDFGIPGVGSGILAPKLQNRWRVSFIGIGGNQGGSNPANLSLQAINISRPNLSFEEIKLDRYNSTAYVAGKHSWDPCSLTVQDDVTGLASRVIQDQLQMQQYLVGAQGPWLGAGATASSYKFATKLEMLDGHGTGSQGTGVLETWLMQGCYIASVNWNTLDYGASDAVTIELSLRFDQASQSLGGEGYGTSIGGAGA